MLRYSGVQLSSKCLSRMALLQGSKAPRLHLQILEAVHFFSVLRTKCFRSIVYWLYPGMWWKCVRWRTTHCLVYLSFSIIVRARKEDRWLASVITCRKSFSFNRFYSCLILVSRLKLFCGRPSVMNRASTALPEVDVWACGLQNGRGKRLFMDFTQLWKEPFKNVLL